MAQRARRRRGARRSACAEQAATWGGEARDDAVLPSRWSAQHTGDATLHAELERQRPRPPTRTRGSRAFLRDEYAPKADPRDPVGRERYALFARAFNGIELDLDETYAWGWEELLPHRGARCAASRERILPGESVDAVADHLDHDPTRTIEGVDEFRRWNQDLIDQTIAELDGTHFDIAPPLRRCEAMIAPPGGAAAMYYTGPSEDFTPARSHVVPDAWARRRFPLWRR